MRMIRETGPRAVGRTGTDWGRRAGVRVAAVALAAVLAGPALAEGTEQSRAAYDPVARAIALGLTPEAMDAALDRALTEAEHCSVVAGSKTLGCPVQTAVGTRTDAVAPMS
jgi:hypothetical protein